MSKIIILMCFFIGTIAQGVTHHFEKAELKTGVPADLLIAICKTESGLNPRAYNPDDPGFGAFGMCQVLGTVAERYMGRDDKCRIAWKHNSKNNIYKNCKWFGAYTNVYIAARVLNYQLKRFDNDIKNSISAYNMGTPRKCLNGWVVNMASNKKMYKPRKWGKSSCWKTKKGKRVFQEGNFINQRYVDKVLKNLKTYGH